MYLTNKRPGITTLHVIHSFKVNNIKWYLILKNKTAFLTPKTKYGTRLPWRPFKVGNIGTI